MNGDARGTGEVRAFLLGCIVILGARSLSSKQTAHSYLGRVVEEADDMDLAQTHEDPSVRSYRETMFGVVGKRMVDKLTSTYGTKYRRYTVLLEMGEKVSVRSKRDGITVGQCARVWIDGPGVSPVYLYAPDQAEIEAAEGCRK